jgi:hypothetical protein
MSVRPYDKGLVNKAAANPTNAGISPWFEAKPTGVFCETSR